MNPSEERLALDSNKTTPHGLIYYLAENKNKSASEVIINQSALCSLRIIVDI